MSPEKKITISDVGTSGWLSHYDGLCAMYCVLLCTTCTVQLTINHHTAEMSELHIKLIHEQQKAERQLVVTEQQDVEIRDLHRDVKVGRMDISSDSTSHLYYTVYVTLLAQSE